jgi:serine/threonine protein kinase
MALVVAAAADRSAGAVAPEIFEKDDNYSFPVDVYSFGLIIWEITTREQPYIDIKPHFKVRSASALHPGQICGLEGGSLTVCRFTTDSAQGSGWRASSHSKGLSPRMVSHAPPPYLPLPLAGGHGLMSLSLAFRSLGLT